MRIIPCLDKSYHRAYVDKSGIYTFYLVTIAHDPTPVETFIRIRIFRWKLISDFNFVLPTSTREMDGSTPLLLGYNRYLGINLVLLRYVFIRIKERIGKEYR